MTCWGVLVGLGTGSMALVLAATVANRWFTARRGLVTGILNAGSATGQLILLPVLPVLVDRHGWRAASLTAPGLLALVGVFDVVGTIFSGWLTDRMDNRLLLGCYHLLRGLSLFALPSPFTATPHAQMLLFILFYGLDWVATVPSTVTLCRELFGDRGTLVFGWVFAMHQIGAGAAAWAAGALRTSLGTYDVAWHGTGALCLVAAGLPLAERAGDRTPVVLLRPPVHPSRA